MPFSPLPKIFLDLLGSLRPDDVVVDLGCGDGEFGRLLHEHGVACIGLDKVRWDSQGSVQIVGNALALPLKSGRAQLLLAANLVRHVLVQDSSGCFLKRWFDALRPGGCVFICEDDPGSGSAAVNNYHRVQQLLNRVMPGQRGPLLGLGEFRQLVTGCRLAGRWAFGQDTNRHPADCAAVLRLLRGSGSFSPTGEVAGLMADISDQGLAYGRFWWACWQKEH